MIRRWRERRAERLRRAAAEAHYRELLDRFISAGEAYLDTWADAYDRSRQ